MPEMRMNSLKSRAMRFSRFLVHWDLRESMRETDVEVILQRAKEKYLEAKPRIISDNGPQFYPECCTSNRRCRSG